MIRNRKKWIMTGLAVMTASALMLGGCGSANASNTARTTEKTARQVDLVVASIKPINESSFNFPAMFGNDFFVKGSSDSVTPTSTDIVIVGDETDTMQPEKTRKNRSFDGKRRNGYKSKHFDINKINNENVAINSYYDKLDDLYVLCADISAANEKINTRLAEIKSENAEMKKLSREMKKSKKASGDFRKIQGKNTQTKNDLKKLYKERKQINKQIKALPKNGDNLNVENMTVRYNAIMNKLESRLQLLDSIKNDMTEINNSMACAIEPMNAKTKTSPVNINTPTSNSPSSKSRFVKTENNNITAPNTTSNEKREFFRKFKNKEIQNEQPSFQPFSQPKNNKPFVQPEANNPVEKMNVVENPVEPNQNVTPVETRNPSDLLRERIRINKKVDDKNNKAKPVRNVREENRRLERARRIDRSPEQQERDIRHRQGREKPQILPHELEPQEVSQFIA